MDLRYDDKGTGPVLLLVHGHPFDRTMWHPQLEHFSATHRVLVPDLRGYGETPVRGTKTLLQTFAEDLADLLDHLHVDRCVLGGLSMGGQIAMEFQRRFPERLTGLLLADTSPLAETGQGKQNRTEMAARLLREGMGPYADEVLRKMVAPGSSEVDEHVLAMMRGARPEGAAAALRGRAERPDYVETLRTVRVPTLVVVGSEDEFTPLADAELIHRSVPHSELVVIEGAAHLPNLERPAEFNTALARLLSA
ncbi:alpha/beta hydrolase [Amycolatopsis acidiphila]|uniref:Alpha/beta fold hydrolase n=1 Tax=Amycolatopsis acidiphila TaxID=715473 RepID=A0A558A846_9PSEU|nr:alpha/beta fold hydrolase [Amycolatopsis acidiphila]TVT20418.1 alpha/beta fold hydrolase [Amycolatopsis acidiphila]UIJ59218.1 alpha/beta hydrolase [Amycolatopsis acidiphila]GHG79201.1 alpha/beta hydrolase [Amycolatopsis acidiphila]